MAQQDPPFTVGIEEEYLLVDRETRDLADDPPQDQLLAECEALCEGQVSPELMRSQIEVGTAVCRSIPEARKELARLRQVVVDVSAQHGLAPIAASTHPFARWQEQKQTPRPRYLGLTQDMQVSARRLLICGMHVHIGIDDDDLRIDLMNQFSYFLPHLLALSCSSPFWEGEDTGLKSCRLTVFDGLPRTRLPERFVSFAEYRRTVDKMVTAGLLEDATKLWWDMRPSARYPTLEVRICDVCPRMEDALAIAALAVSIMRMLYRLRVSNQRWRIYANMLISENRWRAMRHGTEQGLVDFGKDRVVPHAELLDEIIDMVRPDAEALGCAAELEHNRSILEHGNSAERQVRVFRAALAEGSTGDEALAAVVDSLVAETAEGLEGAGA